MRSVVGRVLILALSACVRPAAGEPLDLAACVRRALLRNPEVQDARDSAIGASLAEELALSEYNLKVVPLIDGGLQGANETNQRYQLLFSRKVLATGTEVSLTGGTSVFSSVPQRTVPRFSETRIAISQPLLQGRTRLETHERIDDAERRVAAARSALEVAKDDLVLEVVRRYHEIVGAEELTAVATRSFERVNELGEMARAKLALGSVSKMDVFRADLRAARIRNVRVELEARRDAALDALKVLLGVEPRVHLEIAQRIQGPAATELVDEDPVERALERRVEMIEARAQVADRERQLVVARQRSWPAVFLAGQYARQGFGDTFEDSTRLDREEWSVGLRSTISLDRTPERVAIAQAELALRAQERTLRRVRDEVIRQVRDGLRALERARAERALAAEIAGHAEQQAELARFRYEKGITNNFDLVQAEEQRAEAKSSEILAAIQEVVSAALVRRATGTLRDEFREGADAPW